MPILDDILDHKVIGPAIRKGLQEGRQQGLQEGLQKGALAVLRRQIERRFGALPTRMEERLASLTEPELDDFSLRLLDAKSLEELFS